MARVKMPDGQIVELPDNPTPEQLAEIDAAMGGAPDVDAAAGRKIAARRLGLLTRIPYEVATGTVGMLGDFSAGLMSPFTGGAPSPIGSKAMEGYLDKFLPKPETFEEKAVDFVGQMALGRADVAGRGLLRGIQQLAPSAPAGFNAAADQTREVARELHRQGIRLMPDEGGRGFLGKALAGIGGKERTAQKLQNLNEARFTEMGKAAGGLNPQLPLTRENLVRQAQTIADIGYQPVRNIQHIGVGGNYRAELARIARDLATNRSFPADDRAEVLRAINRNLYDAVDADGNPAHGARLLQQWTGDDAVKQIQALRERASNLFQQPGGDKDVPRALNRIANAIEDQIDFSLTRTGQPGVVDQFREARTQLARNFAMRRILSDQHTGTVDPTKAKALQETGEQLTGELATMAQAGSPKFSKSTKAPTGQPQAYTDWERNIIGGALASTLIPGPQPYSVALAAGLGSKPLFRGAAVSGPMQSLMFGDMPQLVGPETQRLMQMQAVRQGLVPLFSQGEE